jgi:hypothetical protein
MAPTDQLYAPQDHEDDNAGNRERSSYQCQQSQRNAREDDSSGQWKALQSVPPSRPKPTGWELEEHATKKSGRTEQEWVYKGLDLGRQNGNPC